MKYSKTELLQVMKWMRISRIDTKKLKGKLLILHSKQLLRRDKRSKRLKDENGVKMTYRQEQGFDVHSFIHKTQIFLKIRSGEGLEGGGGGFTSSYFHIYRYI